MIRTIIVTKISGGTTSMPKPFKPSSKLVLVAKFRGKVVKEIQASAVFNGFEIGRNRECALQLPEDDRLVSSVHAVISCKRGRWIIVDKNSRNHMFVNGRAVEEAPLEEGITIGIGECEMRVCASESNTAKKDDAAADDVDRLEILNGVDKGTWFDLTASVITIGSGEDCMLRLDDVYVSRRHAEIMQENGNRFLFALGSTNPTAVNGERMETGVKRMLHDSDKISIAHHDFRFLSGKVIRRKPRILLKLAITAVVAAFSYGGWLSYIQANPSAEEFLFKAKADARAENFASARESLKAGLLARNASRYVGEINAFSASVDRYERSAACWKQAADAAAKGDWGAVRAAFSDSAVDDARGADANWSWNEQSKKNRKTGAAAKILLDALAAASPFADGGSEASLPDAVRAARDSLSGAIRAQSPLLAGSQFAALATDAERVAEMLSADLRDWDEFNRLLAVMDSEKANLTVIAPKIEAIAACRAKWVSASAGKCAPALKRLAEARSLIAISVGLICEMRFDEVKPFVGWPSDAALAIHPNLLKQKLALENQSSGVAAAARDIGRIAKSFAEYGLTADSPSPFVSDTSRPTAWDSVLNFALLSAPPPDASRAAPADAYDKMLRYDAFYAMIFEMIPDDMSLRYPDESQAPFLSDLEKFRKLCREIADASENRYFRYYADAAVKNDGALARLAENCRLTIKARDELALRLAERSADAAKPRDKAVLLAASLYLSPRSEEADYKALRNAFLAARGVVLEAADKYESGVGERKADALRSILDAMIPGEKLGRRYWEEATR